MLRLKGGIAIGVQGGGGRKGREHGEARGGLYILR